MCSHRKKEIAPSKFQETPSLIPVLDCTIILRGEAICGIFSLERVVIQKQNCHFLVKRGGRIDNG